MKTAYAITGGLSVAAVAALLLSSTSLYKQVVPIPGGKETTQAQEQPQEQPQAQPVTVYTNPDAPRPDAVQNEKGDKEPMVAPQPASPQPQSEIKSKVAPLDRAAQVAASDEKHSAGPQTAPQQPARTASAPTPELSNDIAKKESEARDKTPAEAPMSINGADTKRKPAAMPAASIGRAYVVQERRLLASPETAATTVAQDEGRDRFETIKNNPTKLVSDEPVSTFSADVDTASYSFTRGELNQGQMPQPDAVRVEEMINYFDYDYALPASKDEPFQPNISVFPSPWNANNKILQIGVKAYDIKPSEKPRANLTFLIDVSGSMSEPNKLPLLKQSMRMLVNELKPDDSVALVVYAGNAGTALAPTRVKNKQAILAAIDNLEAGGSTAGGEGINLAYSLAETNFDKDGVNRVILATDGDFNVGITDPEELKKFIVKKRESGVTLSVLGFGRGNYNDELMQKLAQNGNGNAAYIDTINEARKVLVNEAGSTLFTVAKDVKLQVEFNPQTVSEYRLIGYTTRILNREDFNNDKVDAGDIGAGHKVTALYEITPKGAAGSVDPLRYGVAEPEKPAATSGGDGEYAFLKIRYKLPDGQVSKLMTRAITHADDVKDAASAPRNLGFAAAVAAFGQKLAGDSHLANYSYDDIFALAQSTKGADDFGYRSEFIQLVRTAKVLSDKNEPVIQPERSSINPDERAY